MAAVVRGRGPAFDIRAVEARPAFGGWVPGPIAGASGFAQDTVKGACAGLLALLGATHMTARGAGAAITPIAETGGGFDALNTILQNFSVGGIAGPVELLGGAALFFAARRTIARTIGLLAFIGFIAAYMNGVELPEMLAFLSDWLDRAAGALDGASGKLAAK